MATIEFNGTGGIIQGDFGTNNINVNLDAIYATDATNKGSSNYITATHTVPSTADFSMSWWARTDSSFPTNTNDYGYPISNGAGGGGAGFGTLWETGKTYQLFEIYPTGGSRLQAMFCGTGSGTGTGSKTISAAAGFSGGWNHYAVVVDRDGDMLTYFNGIQSDRITISGSTGAIAGASTVRILDGYDDDGFVGEIADVRIYSDLLTADEIKVLASKINSEEATTGNLTNHWKIAGDVDGTINDYGSGADNGSVQGTLTTKYDSFSLDAQETLTTDGTFTVTQGKLEGKSLTSIHSENGDDVIELGSTFNQDVSNGATIGFWWRQDTTGNYHTFMAAGSSKYLDFGHDRSGQDGKYGTMIGSSGTVKSDLVTVENDVWYHVTVVYEASGISFYQDGISIGGTTGQSYSGEILNGAIARLLSETSGGAYELDGNLRDMRFYDFSMGADQVASLYNGTYNVTPKHWWKLDDSIQGTNTTTAADSGWNGTAKDGTLTNFSATNGSTSGASSNWNNNTLDLDKSVTIGTNGTLSAPRGTLNITGTASGENWLTRTGNGVFTHNNGTVDFKAPTSNASCILNTTMTGANAFYDLHATTTTWLRIDSDIDIHHEAASGYVFWMYGGVVTMGTDDYASGTDNSNNCIGFNYIYGRDGNTYLYGANQLKPYRLNLASGTHLWINSGNNNYMGDATHVKWGNMSGTLTMAGTADAKLKIMGDMEFDAVQVGDGDTLDLNGHRVEFGGGLFVLDGGILTDGGEDSLIHITGTHTHRSYAGDSSTQWSFGHHLDNPAMTLGNTDMIIAGGAASFKMPSTSNDFARNALVTASGTQTINSGVGFCPQNLIAASEITTHSSHNNKIDTTNLTIPTGGTLTANASTLTVSGDFTTSGGLLGPSCLSLDRDNTEYARSVNHADLDLFNTRNAMTAECWFKTSYTGSNHQHIFNLKDNDGSPQVMQMYIDYSTGKVNGRIFTSGTTSSLIGASDVRDGKWHHVAIVYDGDTGKHSLYIDGKLEAEETGSGAVYAATDCEFNIGVRYSLDQGYFEGEIDEVRLFAAAKTAAQIRADMFTAEGTNLTHFNSQADGSTDGLVGRWGCNDGTGSTLTCSNTNLNMTIKDHDAGPAAYSDAWAGEGTFTYGTSTLNFTKSGTALFNFLNGEDVYNLTQSTGNTLSLRCADNGGGRLDLYGTLDMSGVKMTTHADSSNTNISFREGGKTLIIDNPTTALNDLYRVKMDHSSGTNTIPACTVKRFVHENNGTTTLSGAMTVSDSGATAFHQSAGTFDTSGSNHAVTVTGEMHSQGTFTSNSSTVTVRNLLIEGGTFNSPDGSGMLNITGEGSSGLGDGYAFRRVSGAFVDNTGTVTFKTPTTTSIRMGTAAQDFYNVIIDESSAGGLFYVNDEGFTVTNDLTLTDGDFDTTLGTATPLIDIQGDLTIGANNTFGGITQTQTSDISFGSVTIASGGELKATSGTTTITDESSGNYAFENQGTFTHNNGKVLIDFDTPNKNDNTDVKCNEFYDFEIKMNGTSYSTIFRDLSGDTVTFLGDLTITQGKFDDNVNADDYVIHGNTIVESNGSFGVATGWHTGDITHHGLVVLNGGTYYRSDAGGTVKMGGIRNIGGSVL